jgi:aryl-alcohol dehydrogenase-like predicted oxidoreductase
MEKRVLGKTGHRSSIITLGGAIFIYPIEKKKGDAFIKYALDHGVNHVDVAPTYGDAEVKLGKWIKEYRDDLFLGCKTRHRTKKDAEKELHKSLKNLQTDYFDLYQFHGLDTPTEISTVVSKTGSLQVFEEAREEGLIKHIGITSHNPENILKAFELIDFDTVLLPVNYVLHAHPDPQNDYEPVLNMAKEKNIGVIAMKSIAKGPYPTEKRTRNTWYQPFIIPEELEEALRFTLSQPVTTAASSSDIEIARMQIEKAEDFEPMTLEEQEKLLTKASEYKPLYPRR